MPYSYPKSLVAGTPENVNDLNTNLTGAAADWENAFSVYKVFRQDAAIALNGVAGTLLFLVGGGFGLPANGFGPTNVPSIFHRNPADQTAAARTNQWRIRAACLTNGTAPAITFTLGLYPITAVGGGANVLVPTLGAVVTGSTVAFATPGANAINTAATADFAAPAAGRYALGVVLSGTQAANSAAGLSAELQYRQT